MERITPKTWIWLFGAAIAVCYVFAVDLVTGDANSRPEDRPATQAEIQERITDSQCWKASLTEVLSSGRPILKSMVDDPVTLSRCKTVDQQLQMFMPSSSLPVIDGAQLSKKLESERPED